MSAQTLFRRGKVQWTELDSLQGFFKILCLYTSSVPRMNLSLLLAAKSTCCRVEYTKQTLPHSRSGFPLVLGVVHTPLKSRALPSMVFILRKMSALLQVDRAGDSESGLSGLRGSFLCRRENRRGGTLISASMLKVKLKVRTHVADWKLVFDRY